MLVSTAVTLHTALPAYCWRVLLLPHPRLALEPSPHNAPGKGGGTSVLTNQRPHPSATACSLEDIEQHHLQADQPCLHWQQCGGTPGAGAGVRMPELCPHGLTPWTGGPSSPWDTLSSFLCCGRARRSIGGSGCGSTLPQPCLAGQGCGTGLPVSNEE